MKLCNKCEIEKELSEFKPHPTSKDGLRKSCYDCIGEKNPNKSRAEKRREEKPFKKVQKKLKKLELSDEDRFMKRLLKDFPSFLAYSYSYINLPNPTPIQIRIATLLGENRPELILQAPRGVGKSWITGIFGAWRLLRNPDEKILIISGTATLAEKISKFMRTLLHDIPLLNHLEPDGNESDSVKKWDVKGCRTSIETSVSAMGITGAIVGKRATLVIADDVEIPSNSATQVMREKLLDNVKEFSNILIPDIPGSVIFLGTPQSMESIYSKLPYTRTIIPAQVPTNVEAYEGCLDPWVFDQGEPGTPTDKVRFPMAVLDEKLSKIGLAAYMLQYMQDITLSDQDKYPLKQANFILADLDKEMAPLNISYGSGKANRIDDIDNIGWSGDYLYKASWIDERREKYDKIIMSIDPSGEGTDETTYAIIGIKNGFVFVLDIGGTGRDIAGNGDEALMKLALKAKEYKVHEVVPEKNWGGGTYTHLLKHTMNIVYPCTIIDDFSVKGQKEVRIINNISPLLSNHRLVFDYNLVKTDVDTAKNDYKSLVYSLVYQMTHLTSDKQSLVHDDRVDALALACQYVNDYLVLDADTLIKQAEKEEMKKWLAEKIYGNQSSSNASFIKKR